MRRCLILALLLVGQGCGEQERAGPWCPGLPTTAEPPRPGLRNTEERVRRVQERHSAQLLRCPGVVGHGVGHASVPIDGSFGGTPISPSDPRHVLSVSLREAGDDPGQTLFLDGVPLRFTVTGTYTLLR